MIFKGDINGDGRITLEDQLLCQLAVVGNIILTDEQKVAADTNNDDNVNVVDMANITKHIMGRAVMTEFVEV